MFKSYEDLQARTSTLTNDLFKLQAEIAERQVSWARDTFTSGFDLARQSSEMFGRFWLSAFSMEKPAR